MLPDYELKVSYIHLELSFPDLSLDECEAGSLREDSIVLSYARRDETYSLGDPRRVPLLRETGGSFLKMLTSLEWVQRVQQASAHVHRTYRLVDDDET